MVTTKLTDGSTRFDLGPELGQRRIPCGCLFVDYQHVSDLAPCAGHAALEAARATDRLTTEVRRTGTALQGALIEVARAARGVPEGALPPLWWRALRWVAGDAWLRRRALRRHVSTEAYYVGEDGP